ncbi:MAG: ribonuclease III [Clostridia bacterium]|nr:ribonuclease III [Clostridia bacterium]
MDTKELENLIGYKFNDEKLLKTAMTHSSYANDILGDNHKSNERLEFLGDALLDAVVGEMLYKRFPERDEGFLTKLRADIVCEKALGNAALKMGLNKYLLLGRGEEQKGGRNKLSIVSDSVESLIAAVYLDSGKDDISNVKELILKILAETIELACAGKLQLDSKTALQEKCQAKGITDIKYQIIAESGPDHDKSFTAEVKILGKAYGTGSGKTKKEAESEAAKIALLGMEE